MTSESAKRARAFERAGFEEILQVLEEQGQFKGFRSVADTLLIAIDGTEYFSSSQIHCSNCSTRTQTSGETRYVHSVITPVIVAPGQAHVIPLVPEFIVPQDGHDKQDCETAAAKRWLMQHGERFSPLKVTVLGDDLYCHQPLCQRLLDQHLNVFSRISERVTRQLKNIRYWTLRQ